MLTFEQIKALENAFGPEKAKPVVEAIASTDSRVMTSLLAEIATKEDMAKVRGEIASLRGETREEAAKLRGEISALRGELHAETAGLRAENAGLRGDLKRLEIMIKVLIGLAIVAIASFSPNLAALIRLAK